MWFQKCHEELGELLLEHPKCLEIVRWWDLFVQNIHCFSYKILIELCVMTLKGVAKFKWKLTYGLKNDMRNLVNFYGSSWKSENLHFDWIHFSEAYRYLDENIQKCYVSWHWRVIQSLKKNWLLDPKMTRGIWWILMRAVASLGICTLMCNICQ